jgi:hypothetical protein
MSDVHYVQSSRIQSKARGAGVGAYAATMRSPLAAVPITRVVSGENARTTPDGATVTVARSAAAFYEQFPIGHRVCTHILWLCLRSECSPRWRMGPQYLVPRPR